MAPLVVLKYKAPVTSGLPSLSCVGGYALGPKYLSSKSSYADAAAIAAFAAFVAEVAAAWAEAAAPPTLPAKLHKEFNLSIAAGPGIPL